MDECRKVEAIAAARREIARRIARLCTPLSPEEFEKLLDRMARVQWKYDVLPVLSESALPIATESIASTIERTQLMD